MMEMPEHTQVVTVAGYVRNGKCNRCGKCCSLVGLHPNAKRFLKSFNSIGECPHLRGENFCTIYDKRPHFCIDFPATPGDIEDTPECGFSFGMLIQKSKEKT